ncbi:MAG TPA: Ig-like domain-containing protein, partial [Pirellula sp.]|nr:Ig-like domain-containing protein [Pirellula sp.]
PKTLVVAGLLCFLQLMLANKLTADDSTANSETHLQKQRWGTSSVEVELRQTSDSATFAVTGLSKLDLLRKLSPDELQKKITIRVHQQGHVDSLPSLLGTCSIKDSELRFTSRFRLSPAVRYRVELDSRLIDSPYELPAIVFTSRDRIRLPAATVSAVYPTADILPENLLKFYIHFSAPMSRGEAYQRIHLIQGVHEVEAPFLELGEELWDTEQKRFTLFIHPGRIKRGLKPREDSGTPMTEGKEYSLRIDAAWLGADRQPLAAAFVKKFRVIGPDGRQPNPKNWKIVAPSANSKQPISLTFDEPLDHAMLNRVVQIRDASKALVAGSIGVKDRETVWCFEPTDPWKPGTYIISVATNIEDLAGNNLARPFETKELEVETAVKVDAELAIEFVIP